jgi:hypothetical protein
VLLCLRGEDEGQRQIVRIGQCKNPILSYKNIAVV